MLNRVKSLFVSSKADRYRLNPRVGYTDVVYMVRERLIEFKDIDFEQMKNLRFNINNEVDYSSLYHAAIVADYKNYELFPSEWKEDSDTILLGIITHSEFYGVLPAEKKGIFSFLFKAWQTHPDVYPELAIELKNDPYFVYEVLNLRNTDIDTVAEIIPEIGSELKRKLGGKNYLVGLKELCSREILVDKYQIGKDERDASIFSSAL